jgi:hypothetical protein
MLRGLLTSTLAGILSLSLLAPSAQACLNDRETKGREIEFQSQYSRSISPETPAPSAEQSPNYLDYIILGTGGVLGMSGLGIGLGVGIVLARKST